MNSSMTSKPDSLHRIRHRSACLPQRAERRELGRGPLPGQQLAAELGAPRHGPGLAAAPHPSALLVGGVAVEHAPLGRPIALRGKQRLAPARYRPVDEMDVGFLAGLEDAELGVDGSELGDNPVRDRFGAVRGAVPTGVVRKVLIVVL